MERQDRAETHAGAEAAAFGRRCCFILRFGGISLRVAYIGFHTLTDAQRVGEFLKLRNIRSRVARMPSGPGISCSYGLKLRAPDAERAAEILAELDIRPGRTVFRREGGAGDRDLL